jgi:hypothetical protein
VEAAIMTDGQKSGESQVQLSSDMIVFRFGDALQQMVDDPQQFILI